MQKLIQGCKKNDPVQQRALFVRFAPLMMTVCRRYTQNTAEAEDILQEAFIKIFRNFALYNEEKGILEAWIRRIVVHKAIEYWRKNQRSSQVFSEAVETEGSYIAEIELRMDEEALLSLIAQLPEAQRVVFNLYAIEGYAHAEIAESIGISEGSSRTYLTRARKQLQMELDKELSLSQRYV